MSITKFREELSEKLMRVSTETVSDVQGIGGEETEEIHYLRETQEREGGKRTDRRKRRYCIGCYDLLTEQLGREIAKKKAKRVTTECSGCVGNPRFCFSCFPKFHASSPRQSDDCSMVVEASQ